MKRVRSTGKPTKAEAARIVAAKEGPCMACAVWDVKTGRRCDGEGCDYHHTKSGNIRRGHDKGFALCIWHHRGIHPEHYTAEQMRAYYGPSLMDGGKAFRGAYGDDDSLIEMQTEVINAVNEAETMHFMEFGDEV